MDQKNNKNFIKIQIKKKDTYFDSKEISELYSDVKKTIIQNYKNFEIKPFYQIQRKKIKFNVIFDPDKIEFWKKYESQKWEPEIFNTIEKYVCNDTYFIDIGAWIGPITLFAKNYAKKIISFEPDPVAYSHLKKNIEINKKYNKDQSIILNELAVVSDNNKKIDLYSNEFGNSGSSIYLVNNLKPTQVNSINFIDMINKYDLINKKLFFKIDIEGYEYDILIKNKNYFKKLNASIYFSLHPINIIKKFYGKNNNKFLQIIYFSTIYFKIFYNFPFKYILINKKRISLFKLIFKLIIFGLPEEIHIFCSNKIIK